MYYCNRVPWAGHNSVIGKDITWEEGFLSGAYLRLKFNLTVKKENGDNINIDLFKTCINKYKISTWIDDRLCTAIEHSSIVL